MWFNRDLNQITIFLTRQRCCDHVRPALKELHWLPVAHRTWYKVALLMFMVHDNRCLVYLSESVQPVTSNPVLQRLRSASSLDFMVPRTRTKNGDRAFSVAGLTVWNSLSESSDQLRLLLVLSASWKPICSTFRFNLLLSFINIVMPSRSGFVVGWALNYPSIVL